MRRWIPAIVALSLLAPGFPVAAQAPAGRDPVQSVGELLARMTIEEKVGQLTQVGAFPGVDPEGAIRKGGAGSVLWLNDTKRFDELQRAADPVC